MEFSIKKYSTFGLLVGSFALLSCGRSATSNEKTSFTRIDSLTETYLTLQDTLLHSWNILIKDEQEKMNSVNAALDHLKKLTLPDPSQLASLSTRFEQLKQLHLTQKTLSNQYVIEEYDFATNSLISEILSISDANPALLQNKDLLNLIDKIKIADQRTSIYRLGYDSIAYQLNVFIEKNKLLLRDVDNGSLEKKPMFSVATSR
ncbi:MAG: hypothetical protein ACKVOQ_08455 [Cyclobacteriaceae bacterium]